MKAKNKKLNSILTLVIMIVIIVGVSGLAYIACTAVGQGQSTKVEQVAGASNEETSEEGAESPTPSTDNETKDEVAQENNTETDETKDQGESIDDTDQATNAEVAGEKGDTSASTKKSGFFESNRIKLGLDLQGGVNIVYEPELEGDMSAEELRSAMEAAQALIQKRLDAKGYTEAEVAIEGTKRLRVDIPGVEDPQKAVDEIGAAGMLRFIDMSGNEIVTGKNVKSARAGQNSQTGEYFVGIEMDSEGTKLFSDFTANNIGSTILIMLDETVLSMPQISAHITDGSGIISGNFTIEEAQDLANGINAGALPFTLEAISATGVGAKLGIDALNSSLLAGAIGFVIILIFMVAMYRMCGVAADIALVLYVGLMVLTLTALNATLTLPGIAGILLSIGMAVDANVIIFARIKEELALGRGVRAAVDAGFSKAFSAILDGNVTTMIAAVVLYFFGTGLIKSFATTLMIGIVISMFTALVITRSLLKAFVGMDLRKPSFYTNIKKLGKEA